MLRSKVAVIKACVPCAVLISALAGCASPGTPIDHDIDLSVDASVELALAAHKSGFSTSAELLAVEAVIKIDHKGNFGRIDTSDQRQVFQWQPAGLLGSTTTGSYKVPDGSEVVWISTSTSVCGLLPAVSESVSMGKSRMTTSVPWGGGFVPFGFSGRLQGASRSRLSGFSTDAENICKPTPGTSFKYQFVREDQRKFEGAVLSSNKLFTQAVTASCSVGVIEQAARDLDSSFLGNYLPVTCMYSDSAKSARQSKFAYLILSGLYLPLYIQVTENQTNSVRYTAAKYR